MPFNPRIYTIQHLQDYWGYEITPRGVTNSIYKLVRGHMRRKFRAKDYVPTTTIISDFLVE